MPLSGEAKREYQRRWLQKRRDEYIELLGGVCVGCGTDDDLEFHHKVPEDKEFDIQSLLSRKREFVLEELEKCELRCSECHKKTHGKYQTEEERREANRHVWAESKRRHYTAEARHEKYVSTGW